MKPTALVVTTVHWPDDTRIRERLIRTLSQDFSVVYAARSPGPTDRSDLEYVEFGGGRLRRNLDALVLALRSKWDIMVLHDPELIPAGVLSRIVRKRPVVFDVHEDYPAVAGTRPWVPAWMRAPLRLAVKLALRVAEGPLEITLAERGYKHLFTSDHQVFANYPDTSAYPPARREKKDEAVYLGDVTLERGADVAVEACSLAGIPLRVIGRLADDVRAKISDKGANVSFEGVVPNPDAIRLISEASVGLIPLRDIPNYRDSQPTKLLEYLAMGVPVVASDLPGTRSFVEGLDSVWLVAPGDAHAMAHAISEARSEAARQAAMRQVDDVRTRFIWPSDEVRSFYRSLVNP